MANNDVAVDPLGHQGEGEAEVRVRQPRRPPRRQQQQPQEQHEQRGRQQRHEHLHTLANGEIVEEMELDLKYGAHHVIKLFTPVTLCMALVVLVINCVSFYTEKSGVYLAYTPFHETSDDSVTVAWNAFANAGILIAVVAVMTFLLLLAYKFSLYRFLKAWFFLSSFLLLFLFTFIFIGEVLKAFNLGMDYFTLFILLWNFGVLGMMCIYWKGPLRLQQFYNLFASALMALILIKYLPPWTTWAVLGAISIWDLFAVLAPCGPLRMLVETAQEREEQIFPSLIYNSGVVYTATLTDNEESGGNNRSDHVNDDSNRRSGDDANGSRNRAEDGRATTPRNDVPSSIYNEERNAEQHGFDDPAWLDRASRGEQPRHRHQQIPRGGHDLVPPSRVRQQLPRGGEQQMDEEDEGVKLGLGDFIFYSILVGKASSYGDWNTTLACFVAILVGLCLTLMFLAMLRKALPALPFSVAFGLLFYFLTSLIISPFMDTYNSRQIFL